jgi:hypothetical protein
MTRLFVAIWPPADVVSTLAALPRPDVPGVRWSAPDQWMVKVRPFGRVADRLVEPLVTALADALDGAPAVECAVGPLPAGSAGSGWERRSTVWTISPPRYSRPLRRSFRSPIHSRSRPTSCSRAAGCLAIWLARRSALYGRPTRCSSSPTGRAHTTSGSTTWLSFDWVGDGSFSPRSATAQPIDASVDRHLPGASTLRSQRLRQAVVK